MPQTMTTTTVDQSMIHLNLIFLIRMVVSKTFKQGDEIMSFQSLTRVPPRNGGQPLLPDELQTDLSEHHQNEMACLENSHRMKCTFHPPRVRNMVPLPQVKHILRPTPWKIHSSGTTNTSSLPNFRYSSPPAIQTTFPPATHSAVPLG